MRVFIAVAVVLSTSCLPGPVPPTNGGPIECPDGTTRLPIACNSVSALKTRVMDANVGLPSLGLGFGGSYEEKAMGQITESTQHLALRLESDCQKYNACAVPADAYQSDQKRAEKHVTNVDALRSEATPQRADAIWENARPDLAANRLDLAYRLEARSPGGAFRVHTSGEVLHSGDELRLAATVSQPAHLYVLLLSSNGTGDVLFPNTAFQSSNPAPAGTEVLIPPAALGVFALDNVTGEESIQIIASARPLTDIQARLEKMSGGKPSKKVLEKVGNLLCDGARTRGVTYKPASVACGGARTRGITYLAKPIAGAANAVNQVVRARPNDEVIVRQHIIDHR